MFRNRLEKAVFAFAFVLQLVVLWKYSERSWFWNDEAYTTGHVLVDSWGSYLAGNAPEGNVAPLFYLLAKIYFSLYSLLGTTVDPLPWLRVFTALIPVALLSASASQMATRIFPGRQLLGCVAAASVFGALNGTHAYFAYSWQARPYALWMLLSWCFTWALLSVLREGSSTSSRAALGISALALALTAPMATAQVALGIGMLGFFYPGSPAAKMREVAILLPALAMGAFYAAKVPPFPYVWPGPKGMLLIVTAHAKYWMVVPILLVAAHLRNQVSLRALGLLAGLLGITVAVTWKLYLMSGATGFTISNRYYIFLLPAIMALFIDIFRSGKPGESPWAAHGKLIALLLIGSLGFSRAFAEGIINGEPRRKITARQLGEVIRADDTGTCYCVEQPLTEVQVDLWFSLAFAAHERNPFACESWRGIMVKQNRSAVELTLSGKKYSGLRKNRLCEGELP